MADLPSVLFISCSDTDPDDIIKLILDNSEPSDEIELEEGIHVFPFKIDNKYYSAELRLCSLHKESISDKNFSDSVEAVVLYFDSDENNFIGKLNTWLSFINKYQPEIKILLCKNVNSEVQNGQCRRTIQEWCINSGFELVELEPELEEPNDELEDDFQETTGINRIIQALNAHVWPNLVMKPSQNLNDSVNQTHAELNELRKQLCLEQTIEEMLDNNDDDDFSELFSHLSEMKSRVAVLSGDERKAAAEEVVKAFWRAMGGDEDEYIDA